MRFVVGALMLLSLFRLAGVARAEPSADEIVARADHAANWFADAIIDSKLIIKEPGGSAREFEFTTFQKAPDQRLIRFTAPGDVKGMGILVESPETMYVFLPGFQRVRRMGTHVSKQSFMGSDFSSEDMAQLAYAPNYQATLEAGEPASYVLDLKLRAGKQSEFPALKMWVDKQTFMMTRLEYFDDAGKKLKTQTRSDLHKDGEHFVAHTVTITDHRRGDHTTEIHMTQTKMNSGLGKDVFSVRSLVRDQ